MNRFIRSRLLSYPYVDDGFGNEILNPNFHAVWYFIVGETF